MDEKILDEFLDTILSALASAETQSAALLQVLTETNAVSEEQLSRAMEQASNATEIKMRATRLRLKRVLSSVISDFEEQQKGKEKAPAKARTPESEDTEKGETETNEAGSPEPSNSAQPLPEESTADQKAKNQESQETADAPPPPKAEPKSEKPPESNQASG